MTIAHRVLAGLLCLCCLTVPVWATADSDEVVFIVHPKNPTRQLAGDELRPIFQTTKTMWGDGEHIVPFNLPPEDAARVVVDKAVLGLEPERMQRYWIDRKIRGGNRPPKTVANESMVVRLVARMPSAIGYVHRSATKGVDVKIVAVVRDGAVVAR